MSKSTIQYWNPLLDTHKTRWQSIDGMNGLAEELTLAIDENSGDYTRLTRFKPGADTQAFGVKQHRYPEEIFIVSGRLYDAAFDRWLTTGDYASRPAGEAHGPFKTDIGCTVLEISYLSQTEPE